MRTILKKTVLRLLLLLLLFSLFSCSSTLTVPESDAEEAVLTQVITETKEIEAIEPDLLYRCGDGSELSTYRKRSREEFDLACRHFEEEGYTLYSASEMGGTTAKTYVKGSALAHLYYHPQNKELNLVRSETAADTLPPATPVNGGGEFPCTVTQLNQHKAHFNGMGYVVQLTDGSFILYDGGYPESADEILAFLQSHSGGKKPVVRAWVMTHLHGDHTGAFKRLAARENAAELFTLEYLIYSSLPEGNPGLEEDDADNGERLKSLRKAVSRFPDAKMVYAHTGMQFSFCNLSMEILYAPESLFKNLLTPEDFNNTSILSRLKDEKGSVLFTGDLGDLGARLAVRIYGAALASDMVQMSHHGLNGPLAFYEEVKAATLWYPSSTSFYEEGANKNMRKALEASPTTREIIIAGNGQATRPFPGH